MERSTNKKKEAIRVSGGGKLESQDGDSSRTVGGKTAADWLKMEN